MKKDKISNSFGFTLIELIVVIGIISIISSIAVPRIFDFIDRAKTSADQANLKTLNTATDYYIASENLGEKIFNEAESDKARMLLLADSDFLEKKLIEPQDKEAKYLWDLESQRWLYLTKEGKPIVELDKDNIAATSSQLGESFERYVASLEEVPSGEIKVSGYNIGMGNVPAFIRGYFDSVIGLDTDKISNLNFFFKNKDDFAVYIKMELEEWSADGTT